MEFYIFRSIACLGALFIFYKLFLENEKMHTFKRFYLLGSLVLSIIIPLITFTTYGDITGNNDPITIPDFNDVGSENYQLFLDLLPMLLGSFYAIGFSIFGFRFAKNLIAILTKIKRNPKLKLSSYIHVLLQDKVMPHTFFKYIFLNKSKYDAKEIPSEVIIHEQTHAQQKHSYDILFIEILQIIFWFNPLIYVIKHSIKLNHEFLADEAVLSKGIESNHYQNLLLVFSSNTQTPMLANSINYSLIKKRFTVMKTHTSKRKIWIRSFLLFPLVALLLFSFSAKEEIERLDSAPIDYTLQDGATKAQVKEYNKLAKKYNDMNQGRMKINKSDIDRLKYLYNLMSSKQRKNSQPFPNFPPPPPVVEKAPKPMKVAKGVNDHSANIPPPPPKAVKVIKGVNDTDANIPPPPPKAPKVKQEKSKIKKEKIKVKKEQEKLASQQVKLEKRKQENIAERKVLVEKRKVDRDHIKTLQNKKMETQRVAMRTDADKVRLEKREIQIKERQLKQEQKKEAMYNRQVEQKKRSLKEKNMEKLKKENI